MAINKEKDYTCKTIRTPLYTKRLLNSLLLRLIVILLVQMAYEGYAQEIYVHTKDEPLSSVLKTLHQNYGIQVSFNAKLLENCLITTHQTFKSSAEALNYLTKQCNYTCKALNGVFVILPKAKTSKPRTRYRLYTYQGQVRDRANKETLPFASIVINNTSILTDVEGNFSYNCRDSIVQMLVSHLGYFSIDTLVRPSSQLKIDLYPSVAKLQEIMVLSTKHIKIVNTEQKSGISKLNNPKTPYLPGSTNNSIFSFLRLQSGILASGEQTKDYILWGSYKGQTHILFDGITIFNTSGYNDQVGTINPLFIKDIEVLKGGYGVDIGDRVGGIVNITSKSGQKDTSIYQITGTQQMFNGYANIELTSNSTFQVGGRLVFPNILQYSGAVEWPLLFFGDLTAKYTYKFDKFNRVSVTVLGDLDYSEINRTVELDSQVINSFSFRQRRISSLGGFSAHYTKKWLKLGITTTKLAYSQLQSEYNTGLFTGDSTTNIFSEKVTNGISELETRIDHRLPTFKQHSLSIGVRLVYNRSNIKHSLIREFLNEAQQGVRLGAYVKDEISWADFLTIRLGIRFDLPLRQRMRPFVQPRVEIVVSPTAQWKVNFAYGIFHQFITENALLDPFRNYAYHWSVTDNEGIPVLKGMHYLGGISCRYRYWSARLEGYYKNTESILQFGRAPNNRDLTTLIGQAQSFGLDIKLAAHFRNQRIWAAYTLSKSKESFSPYFSTRAPHDQRHEFKVAGMFNIESFFFSVNYVYGSGFPNTKNLDSDENIRPYSRFDIGFLYKVEMNKLDIDIGLSILNLLNTPNVRYDNFVNFPDDKSEYLGAIPITPTIFMNFKF